MTEVSGKEAYSLFELPSGGLRGNVRTSVTHWKARGGLAIRDN